MELTSGRAADLHFIEQDDTLWIVLLDVSAERDAARRMQQKAYDMTLAQEREALLNRRLEAANTALLATQRELEASHDALARAHDRVQAQATELADWNRTLEERVAAQVAELERMARLKRFFAPSLAELIVSSGNERILESHRRDIAVLFCDLRGFTAFAESAEPEEVMAVLHDYHAALVPLIQTFEGTLDRFVGDGLIVYFNDPCRAPTRRSAPSPWRLRCAMAWPCLRRAGADTIIGSVSASALRKALQRSGKSALRDASITARSAQSSIRQRACVTLQRMVKFWLLRELRPQSPNWRMSVKSDHSHSRA